MLDVLIYHFTPPSTFGFQQSVTDKVSGLTIATRLPGGFTDCSFMVHDKYAGSFDWYDRRLLWLVQVNDVAGYPIWEGRIEDVSIVPDGAQITALGFYSHLGDRLYAIPWYSVARTLTVESVVSTDTFLASLDDSDDVISTAYKNGEYYTVLAAGGTDGEAIDTPTWTTGKFGSGLQFDGASEGVSLAYSNRWAFGDTQSFTVEFFIKTATSTGDEHTIITNEPAADSGVLVGGRKFWRVDMQADGKIRAIISDGSRRLNAPVFYSLEGFTPLVISGGSVNDDAWHHVAFVRDAEAQRLRIYIDGAVDGERVDPTTDSITSAAPIRIAYETHAVQAYYRYFDPELSGNFFDHPVDSLACTIDEVRISNVARYTSGFVAPTAAFSTDAWTSLLLHMDENTGIVVGDSSTPGWGGSGDSDAFIRNIFTSDPDDPTQFNSVTIVGEWGSSLRVGDSVIVGHKATQDDIIQSALSICPIISTDYSEMDPSSVLTVDVTPQLFDNGERVMDVIEQVLKFGSGETEPRQVYLAIWENRKPYLFVVDNTNVKWTLRMEDIGKEQSMSLQRTIKEMANRTMATYSDTEGEQDTDFFPDELEASDLKTLAEDSQGEYGIFEGVLSIGSALQGEAEIYAQLLLRDEFQPNQSEINVQGSIGGAAGARHPLWEVRSGDVVEFVDLLDAVLPIASPQMEKLKRFTVLATSYNTDTDTLKIEPEGEISTVQLFLAMADMAGRRQI